MSQISYQIIAAAGVNILLIFLFGKRLRFAFLIISLWWFFWLYISSLSLTGVFVPGAGTYHLYFVLLSSMTFGGMLFYFGNVKYTIVASAYRPQQMEDLDSERHYVVILKMLKWIVLPIMFFFCLRALQQILVVRDFSAYRSSFFGIGVEKDPVFGNGLIHFAYNILILPFLYAAYFIGAAVYAKTGRLKLLIFSTLGIILDAIMQLGRFQLYFILVFSLVALFIRSGKRIRKFVSKFQYIAIVLILLVPIAYISLLRSSSSNLKRIIGTFIIDYHTIGFTVFDKEYADSGSMLNTTISYGRASLGSIEKIVTFFLGRLDSSIISIPDIVGRHLNDNTAVGFNEFGDINANAFSTILYPIYLDGRLALVILLPLIFGYYLMQFTLLSSGGNGVKELAYLFALIYVGIFGIFQPLLTSSFWLYLICISLLLKRQRTKPFAVPGRYSSKMRDIPQARYR